MKGNYLQQTTSADDIFRCIFFLGALRVNYPSLVLVQSKKTRPCLTERLLMGRKESNQTKQTKTLRVMKDMPKENETEFINHYTNGAFVYLGHMPTANQNEQNLEEKTDLNP